MSEYLDLFFIPLIVGVFLFGRWSVKDELKSENDFLKAMVKIKDGSLKVADQTIKDFHKLCTDQTKALQQADQVIQLQQHALKGQLVIPVVPVKEKKDLN